MEHLLSDHNTEVVGFSGTTDEKNANKTDKFVMTLAVHCDEKSIQAGTYHSTEVQTDAANSSTDPTIDQQALLEFMRRMAPSVEDELRKGNRYFKYNRYVQENVTDIVATKLYSLPKHKIVKDMDVKIILWNVYGTKIAVGYSYTKHDDWCDHTSYILIYQCDKNEEFTNEAIKYEEINTCLIDMKFHPSLSSLLVYATEEGKVLAWNLSNDSDGDRRYCICNDNKVTQLSWVKLKSSLFLAIASASGMISLWSHHDFHDDWICEIRYTINMNFDHSRGIRCFDFSPINSEHFVVALEGDILVKCSTRTATVLDPETKNYNPVVDAFEQSPTITHLQFSRFEENIFVTVSSIAQEIRIYELFKRLLVSKIVTTYIPLGVGWNHLEETIFNVWSTNGKIYYYSSADGDQLSVQTVGDNTVAIEFKEKGMSQMMAVAETTADLSVWQAPLRIL